MVKTLHVDHRYESGYFPHRMNHIDLKYEREPWSSKHIYMYIIGQHIREKDNVDHRQLEIKGWSPQWVHREQVLPLNMMIGIIPTKSFGYGAILALKTIIAKSKTGNNKHFGGIQIISAYLN